MIAPSEVSENWRYKNSLHFFFHFFCFFCVFFTFFLNFFAIFCISTFFIFLYFLCFLTFFYISLYFLNFSTFYNFLYIFYILSRLQMIRETSERWEKHARHEKLVRKKERAKDNMKINYTRFVMRLFFSYYYFIPYRTRKSLCLGHNYCFYCEMVRNTRHRKSVSWIRIKNMK